MKWADLMATGGQFYWPSVGTFVAAYGQFFMAANRRSPFIETEEREELFTALETVMTELEGGLNRSLERERSALLSGVDDSRAW